MKIKIIFSWRLNYVKDNFFPHPVSKNLVDELWVNGSYLGTYLSTFCDVIGAD